MNHAQARLFRLNNGDWVKTGDQVRALLRDEPSTGQVSALFSRHSPGEDDRMARVVFRDGDSFTAHDLMVSAIQTVEIRA